MKRKTFSVTGKGQSMTAAILFGIGASLIVSVLLSVLLTSLTVNGSISEDNAGMMISVVRILSVLVGGLISAGVAKGKYIPVIGVTALGYLLVILSAGILFYDGGFHGFGGSVISVLVGAAAACAVKLIRWSKPNRAAKFLK